MIRLDPTLLMCPAHGEAFRTHWPKGFPNYAHAVLGLLGAQDEFAAAYVDAMIDTRGDAAVAITQLLSAEKACCRLGGAALHGLLVDIHAGGHGVSPWFTHICYQCGQRGPGGRQRVPVGVTGSRATMERFVCLHCTAHQPPLASLYDH